MQTTTAPKPRVGNALAGGLLGLVGFTLFAVQDALIKSLQDVPVFQVAFFTVLFSFVPFSLFIAVDEQPRSLKPQLPGLVALRCLFTAGSLLSAFYAFTVLPLVEVYSLIFVAPMLITLLAVFFLGEKIHIIRGVAILLGFAGVIIVLRPGQTELSAGHLAALLAAVCVASTAVVTRKIGSREHALTLILFPMLVNFAITGTGLVFTYQPMSGGSLLTLACIGVLSVAGQWAMISAYRISEAQFVAPTQYIQMIWAVVIGSLFFGEKADLVTLGGSVVIILSGLLIVWRELSASAMRPLLHTRNLRTSYGPQAFPDEADRERARETDAPT